MVAEDFGEDCELRVQPRDKFFDEDLLIASDCLIDVGVMIVKGLAGESSGLRHLAGGDPPPVFFQ